MPKSFIYLEILDPEINALIRAITEIVSGKLPTRPAHLTVRGPYDGKVPENAIATCSSVMKNDVLRIANVGRFSNPNEEVVYFRVDSPNLRNIWWKPDFPIERYGFNPHLSLYRGIDCNWAELLEDFLKGERIELLCAEYRFVSDVSKQIQLLPSDIPYSKQFLGLLETGRVHTTFLLRLAELAKRYRVKDSEKLELSQTRLL